MASILETIQAQRALIQSVLLAIAMFGGGWVASKWTHGAMLRALATRHVDQALGRFMAAVIRYLVLAAAVIAAMDTVGLHTTSLAAVLASAGLAVGLALQGSLSNFASGVMLLFFRPFHIGDKVTIKDHAGVVDDIGVFNTVLVSADNEKMIIPNTLVTGGIIINASDRGLLRGTVRIAVRGGAGDVSRIVAALKAAAQRSPGVLPEPAPEALLVDMADEVLELALQVWYKALDEDQVLHALRCALLEDLAAAGLRLAKRSKRWSAPAAGEGDGDEKD
jgi:small conductance mechanosensitive channel